MANKDTRRKTMLEKITGKTVRDVVPYECDRYSNLGNAELVTFSDGTQKIYCELLKSRDCDHSCGYEGL